MMMCFLCTFFLIFISYTVNTSQSLGQIDYFPKILWSYWHQGEPSASTFTKMCLSNQKHYAEASGWQFKLISNATVHLYLDRDRLEDLFAQLGPDINLQSKADIIRLSLLLKFGGMWMDANSFFVQNLSWIKQVNDLYQIKNKFGAHPDVIMSANHNQPYIERHVQTGEKIQPYPNYENWFMVSKPNSTFFQQVMAILEKVASIGRVAANEYYGSQGVVLGAAYADSDYFLMSNYLFQIAIQMKQIQLDKLNPKQYAVQYYNIWSFESAETALMLQSYYNYRAWPFVSDIQQHPLSVYQDNMSGPNYLIKLTGWHYPIFNNIFDNYIEYNCWNMSQIVAKGSIIYDYLIEYSLELPEVKKIIEYNSLLNKEELFPYCKAKIEDYRFLSPMHKKLLTVLMIMISLMSYWICCWGLESKKERSVEHTVQIEEGLFSNRSM